MKYYLLPLFALFLFACTEEADKTTTIQNAPVKTRDYQNNLALAADSLETVGSLILKDTVVTALPAGLVNMTALEAAGVGLAELPDVSGWTALRKVILDNNQLSELPTGAANWEAIQILLASSNRISRIPDDLSKWTRIRQIKLNDNQLTSFPVGLTQLSNVERLSLKANQIKELPTEIKNLTNLQYLELQNNQLTDLPTEIAGLPSIKAIYIQGNNIPEARQKEIKRLMTGVAHVVF